MSKTIIVTIVLLAVGLAGCQGNPAITTCAESDAAPSEARAAWQTAQLLLTDSAYQEQGLNIQTQDGDLQVDLTIYQKGNSLYFTDTGDNDFGLEYQDNYLENSFRGQTLYGRDYNYDRYTQAAQYYYTQVLATTAFHQAKTTLTEEDIKAMHCQDSSQGAAWHYHTETHNITITADGLQSITALVAPFETITWITSPTIDINTQAPRQPITLMVSVEYEDTIDDEWYGVAYRILDISEFTHAQELRFEAYDSQDQKVAEQILEPGINKLGRVAIIDYTDDNNNGIIDEDDIIEVTRNQDVTLLVYDLWAQTYLELTI